MAALRAFAKVVDGLNEKIGSLISWLTTLLVLVVCYDVFTRYLLRQSSVAVQELEWHIFAVLFLLGAAFTLKHDRHVRVDVLYTRLSPRGKAWVNFFGSLVFLIPFAILVLWTSKTFVVNSFRIGETSPDPGGLAARYLLKACIPFAFLLVLLQGLSLASNSLLAALGDDGKEGEGEREG
ncbi:MAG: TRAP transporter small permease subunit [bacterium]